MKNANTSASGTAVRALLAMKAVFFPFCNPMSKNTRDCSPIGDRYIVDPVSPIDLEVMGFTRESVYVPGNLATCENFE